MNTILVLTYWSYRTGLIQAYTLPYLRIISRYLKPGSRIVLVTLEQAGSALTPAELRAARAELALQQIEWISFPYHRFGIKAIGWIALYLVRLFALCWKERFSAIHCFCTPAGALGVLLSYFTDIPLIIDSYEPHAEAMAENGTWSRSGIAFWLLFRLERLLSHRAVAVIATTPAMREYARTRYGVELNNCQVKPACVDLEHFRRDGLEIGALADKLGLAGKTVCVYAGKTGGTYLDREIFDFLKAARDHWGDRFRVLLLTSDTKETIDALCERSGFDKTVLVRLFVDHHEIQKYLALADFALTPIRPLPAKRYCAPIKDGEYCAMGLPVVITEGIADDSDIIEENRIGAVLRGFSASDYEKAILEIDSLLRRQSKAELQEKIRGIAVRMRGLDQAVGVYRALYGGATEAGIK